LIRQFAQFPILHIADDDSMMIDQQGNGFAGGSSYFVILLPLANFMNFLDSKNENYT
jgi:hypothetical protein